MANQQHLDTLMQGVEPWNKWRREHPDIQPDLSGANLEGMNLFKAHLEGTNLSYANLGVKENSSRPLLPASLNEAFFDKSTKLEGVILGNKKSGFVSLADIDWGGVNLALVDWGQVNMIGDAYKARRFKQLNLYRTAIRANRQLAVALQTQGLNEEAARFAYDAHYLKQRLLLLQLLKNMVHTLKHTWLIRLLLHKPNIHRNNVGRNFILFVIVIYIVGITFILIFELRWRSAWYFIITCFTFKLISILSFGTNIQSTY